MHRDEDQMNLLHVRDRATERAMREIVAAVRELPLSERAHIQDVVNWGQRTLGAFSPLPKKKKKI